MKEDKKTNVIPSDFSIQFLTKPTNKSGKFNVEKFLKAAENVGYIIKRNEAENKCGISQE
jgi:hypothetical protein